MADKTKLLAGCADCVITPPLGASLAGYFRDRICDGVLDDLQFRCLALKFEETTLVLGVFDLLGIIRDQIDIIKSGVQERFGIPPENVFLACTHTHTGPRLPRFFLSDSIEQDSIYIVGSVDEDYVKKLIDQAIETIGQAAESATPVDEAWCAVGELPEQIAFNRRYRMKDGSVRTNPGCLNPDVVEPIGPIDPQLFVLNLVPQNYFLLNYTCHPDVVSGNKASADHPGFAVRRLMELMGSGSRGVYTNGTTGNINHVDVSSPREQRQGYEHARKMGTLIADTAYRLLKEQAEEISLTPLAGKLRDLKLPIRKVSDEERKQAEEAVARADELEKAPDDYQGSKEKISSLDAMFAKATLVLANTKDPHYEAPVQMLRMGDFSISGFPGEAFVELGLDLKSRQRTRRPIACELANDCIGYIPIRESYEQGSYEARHRSAKYEPGSGESMVEALLEMEEEIYEGDA